VAEFELVGHRIVRADDRVGAMPGVPKGIALHRFGESRVRGAAPRRRLGLEHCRTNKRMAELHPHLVELKHPRRHRGVERVDTQFVAGEYRSGGHDLGRVLALGDGRGQNRVARIVGKFTEAAREGALEPPGQGPGWVAGTAGNRKLDERERVTERAPQDLLVRGWAESRLVARQEIASGCVRQGTQVELREAGSQEGADGAFARGGDHRERASFGAAGDECERLVCRRVEAVHVIDRDQDAAAGRNLGDQVEHGESDQNRLGRRTTREADRGKQRLALHGGQRGGGVEDRPKQQVEAGVRKLTFAFDAGRGEDREADASGVFLRDGQQRGFPDSWFTEHDERAAAAGRGVDQGVHPGDLVVPPDEAAPC
jgi:hypothetical protein